MDNAKIKDPIRIKIRPTHKVSIDELIDGWDFKTKENILGLLENYYERNSGLKNLTKPQKGLKAIKNWFLDINTSKEPRIKYLSDENVLLEWRIRYQITGELDHKKSFDKLFEEDLGKIGTVYAIKRLREETKKVFVPYEFGELIKQTYRKHLCNKLEADKESSVTLPKAPLILVVGQTGSGKSATVIEAINEYLFQGMIIEEEDFSEQIEGLKAERPFGFWEVNNPDLADKVKKQDTRDKIFRFKDSPQILKKLFKEKLPEVLGRNEELQQLGLEWKTVQPSDIQTMYYGETGNNLKKAVGDTNIPKIVHLEEFHSIAPNYNSQGMNGNAAESQEGTKITTLNKMLDDTIRGTSPIIWVGTTHSPDRLNEDVYRRFDGDGIVIDMEKYWNNPENLEQIVRMEAREKDVNKIEDEEYEQITKEVYKVFEERTLNITPAYVRKLLSSIIEETKSLKIEHFSDKYLLRNAFENVARHVHADLFKKIVKKPSSTLKFSDYTGRVKDKFAKKANAALRNNDENEKGCVLTGPPGSGKTFLSHVYAAANPDITYISVTQKDLQDSNRPIDGMIENVHTMYNIARMMSPSFVSIQEGDAILQPRRQDGQNPYDKVTNTFLDIFDGDVPLRGVFTAITTNMQDKIDPAFVRAKRASVIEVSGRLSEKNKKKIINNCLDEIVIDKEVTIDRIYQKARTVCYVPADFTMLVEGIISLRDTEYKVIKQIRQLKNQKEKEGFVEQNKEAILGILEYYDADSRIIEKGAHDSLELVNQLGNIIEISKDLKSKQDYPVKLSHLEQSYNEFVQDPTRRGRELMKVFYSDELSLEPQVGFVIGAGVSGHLGSLLPIKSKLVDKKGNDKINVTGAVKSDSAFSPEQNMAVEMMTQSAEEAKSIVSEYLSQLFSENREFENIDATWLFKNVLENKTLHHQFLSAHYALGGPSAGFALTINTLSAIFNIEVINDFGITGAPWMGGPTKEEVGSTVVIGGVEQKTDAILTSETLKRMFVPHINYSEIPQATQEGYWSENKLVRPVKNFRQIVPEVYVFNKDYKQRIENLISNQIKYNIAESEGETDKVEELENKLNKIYKTMKTDAESEILRRAKCLYNFCMEKNPEKHSLSAHAIYKVGSQFDKELTQLKL